MSNKKIPRALALLLTLLCLSGAALAAGGDAEDPLVSLSYLNETVIPKILAQVEEYTAQHRQELEESFQQALEERPGGGDEVSKAQFQLLTLTQGEQLRLDLGCEVMLRIGSAAVTADSAPALVDSTDGSTLGSGASLTTNHLYLTTIEGRILTAQAGTVKLLVRGACEVL